MVTGILDDVGASLLPPHRAHILPIIRGLLAPGKKVNGCDGKLYSGVQCTVYSAVYMSSDMVHHRRTSSCSSVQLTQCLLPLQWSWAPITHHQYQHHAQLSDNL